MTCPLKNHNVIDRLFILWCIFDFEKPTLPVVQNNLSDVVTDGNILLTERL